MLRMTSRGYCKQSYLVNGLFISFNEYNCYSTKSTADDKISITSSPPKIQKCDWIGPAHDVSNLRDVKYFIPCHESELEKDFRIKRQFVHEWNHTFWHDHNTTFLKEKEYFIKTKLDQLGNFNEDGSKQLLSAETMSEFYRKFLQENHKSHLAYNREWYKQSLELLYSGMKVAIYRLLKRLKLTSKSTR